MVKLAEEVKQAVLGVLTRFDVWETSGFTMKCPKVKPDPTDFFLKRAFVRSLEIIGEAVKQIPDDFRAGYPSVSMVDPTDLPICFSLTCKV